MSATNHGGAGTTRRDFLLVGVGALAVSTLPLATRRPALTRRSLPVMGTIAEIAVVLDDRGRAQEAIDAALASLRHVEAQMTRFDPASDIGRANRSAAVEAVAVTPETATVVATALGWAEATDGRFDPGVARAVEVWDVGARHEPPAPAVYARLAGRRLHRAVDVGEWRGRPAIRFTDPDVGLDLGGIAKGYAVDLAVGALRQHGIRHAIVNLGGDLYAMGLGPGGEPWRVGVRTPERADRMVTTLTVSDAAVATSGTYVQYFERAGRRYHHLLDPTTAAPRVCAMQSLTVMASDAMTADAAATAVFGSTPDEAARLLAPAPDARVAFTI